MISLTRSRLYRHVCGGLAFLPYEKCLIDIRGRGTHNVLCFCGRSGKVGARPRFYVYHGPIGVAASIEADGILGDRKSSCKFLARRIVAGHGLLNLEQNMLCRIDSKNAVCSCRFVFACVPGTRESIGWYFLDNRFVFLNRTAATVRREVCAPAASYTLALSRALKKSGIP